MSNRIFTIPSGPKNLSQIFPFVDFNQIKDYYIEVVDTNGDVVATTNLFNVGCLCKEEDDYIRIRFQNALGGFDGVNFRKPVVIHQFEDSRFQRSLNYPLAKTDTGITKASVTSNDTYESYTDCYGESAMTWLRELLDTPKAYIEWKGTQGQADDYLPIIIEPVDFTIIKPIEDYTYRVPIKFSFSNRYLTQRN